MKEDAKETGCIHAHPCYVVEMPGGSTTVLCNVKQYFEHSDWTRFEAESRRSARYPSTAAFRRISIVSPAPLRVVIFCVKTSRQTFARRGEALADVLVRLLDPKDLGSK